MVVKVPLLIFVFAFTVSCVFHEGPTDNSDFEFVNDIAEFAGTYRNLGDSADAVPEIFLSELIWPTDGYGIHRAISRVSIQKINDTQMRIIAISFDDTVQKSEDFTRGKDFELDGGSITLKYKTEGVFDLVMGVGYEKAIIGIDKQGHGKYRIKSGGVGVLSFVLPVATMESVDVRFERIE